MRTIVIFRIRSHKFVRTIVTMSCDRRPAAAGTRSQRAAAATMCRIADAREQSCEAALESHRERLGACLLHWQTCVAYAASIESRLVEVHLGDLRRAERKSIESHRVDLRNRALACGFARFVPAHADLLHARAIAGKDSLTARSTSRCPHLTFLFCVARRLV